MTKKRILDENAPVNELLGKLEAPEKPKRKTPKAKTEPTKPSGIPEGYKLDPRYVEKKTDRLQLVLRHSTANELKHFCKEAGLSVNDYVGGLIERALDEQADIDERDGQNIITDAYKQARARRG